VPLVRGRGHRPVAGDARPRPVKAEGCQYSGPSRCDLVFVDQPAEQIAMDQPGAADRQRWRRLRSPALPDRARDAASGRRSGGVGAQDHSRCRIPRTNDPVQAFVPYRSHPPLGEGVRPRRSDWRADHLDVLGPKDLVERSEYLASRSCTRRARICQPGGLTEVEGMVTAVNRIIAPHILPGHRAMRPGVLGHLLAEEWPGSASKARLGNRLEQRPMICCRHEETGSSRVSPADSQAR
jgi:hypothetical protein